MTIPPLVRKCDALLRRPLIALGFGLAIIWLHANGHLDYLDSQLADARFHLARSDPSPQVAVVAIDAHSLNERPVWPWPRSWHAQVVDRLVEAGAAQIVLDIDFSAASTREEDDELAAALHRAGDRVILPVFQQAAQRQSNEMVQNFPLAALARNARIGSANIRADRDGIVRETSRFEEWGGALVPTLAGAAAGVAGSDTRPFFIDYGIRTDRLLTVSYLDVLDGRVPRGMLAGKIVFVGATALELGDIAATPVNGLTPGTVLQALATSSLLQGRTLHKVSSGPLLVLLVALFMAVSYCCRRRRWWAVVGYGGAWAIAVFVLSTVIQVAVPVMVDLTPLLLAVVTAQFTSFITRLRDLDLTVIGQSIALRRGSNLMRRVVDNTFDGLLTLDSNGTIRSLNPAAERILRRKSGDLVQRPFAVLISSLPVEKSADWLNYLADQAEPREITVLGADGISIETEIAVTRLPDEPSAAFIAVLRDITDRKTAMAAAARNLSRLKDAIDSVASGFALFDANERLVMCNQNFRDLYPAIAHLLVPGWRTEDIVLAQIKSANPSAEDAEVERMAADRMNRFRSPTKPFEMSIERDRWILVDERKTSEGGIVGVHTDITEARRQQAELRAAHDQAHAANRSKSQFLANMSHELRTPLNAIIGFSDVMKTELMGPLGTEAYRGYVKDINESAAHLLAIINDILDISSIEAGRPRLRESLISPEEACRSVETLMSGKLLEAHVSMAVSIRGLTGGLWADGRLVKQMLINLISNSIKFSGAHTLIQLSVTQAGDHSIVFSVADQGIGIAPSDMDRILHPFEQVENALTRSHEGVGLGLSLVKSMAEAHGATLNIASIQDEGTTVTIAFPPERYHEWPADSRHAKRQHRSATVAR
ncbi:MAG: CHASE2 domain-containing protein [Dongiaceae bacterium]